MCVRCGQKNASEDHCLCRVMPNSDPEGPIFLSAPNNHDIFFFLHAFRSPAFDINVGVAMNESCCFTLTPAILKVDVVCDATMTSTASLSDRVT